MPCNCGAATATSIILSYWCCVFQTSSKCTLAVASNFPQLAWPGPTAARSPQQQSRSVKGLAKAWHGRSVRSGQGQEGTFMDTHTHLTFSPQKDCGMCSAVLLLLLLPLYYGRRSDERSMKPQNIDRSNHSEAVERS